MHFHPKNPLVSDREEYSSLCSLGWPSAEDRFSIQSCSALLSSMHAWFCIFTWLRDWSSVCVTSFRLTDPNYYFFSSVVSGNICKHCGTQECRLGFVCTSSRCPGHSALATAALSLAASHPRLCVGPAQQDSRGGRSPHAHAVSCQHLHSVEVAFPPQGLAGAICC